MIANVELVGILADHFGLRREFLACDVVAAANRNPDLRMALRRAGASTGVEVAVVLADLEAVRVGGVGVWVLPGGERRNRYVIS